MEKVVVYTRVSTQRQGKSGLGLDAQQRAVADYVARTGAHVLEEFQEVESGKRDDNRPMLQEALALCKVTKARLVVAKLDRLSRNAAFLMSLRDSGVEFTCADMPDANNFTIGIMACLAQYERQLISERTKAALARKKIQLAGEGKKLGNPQGAAAFGENRGLNAAAGRIAVADRKAQGVARYLLPLRAEGLSMAKIAERLNERGIPTPRQGAAGWKAATVKRALERLAVN